MFNNESLPLVPAKLKAGKTSRALFPVPYVLNRQWHCAFKLITNGSFKQIWPLTHLVAAFENADK